MGFAAAPAAAVPLIEALGAGGTLAAASPLATGMMSSAAATPFITEGLMAAAPLGMSAAAAPVAESLAPFAAGMAPGASSAWQTALAAGMPADAGSAARGMPWGKMARAAGVGLLAGDDQQQAAPAAAPPPQQPVGNMVDAGMGWMQGGLLGGLDARTRQMLMQRMMRGTR